MRRQGQVHARWILLRMSVVVLLVLNLRPGPRTAQAPGQLAARDRPAAAAATRGTARISGHVVSLDTGRPVNRAHVAASGASLGGPRTSLTDASGRYEIAGLPAGTVTIAASKPPFLTGAYGQRSWPGAAVAVQLQEGQALDHLDIALPRGGVITGQVFDESGEPLVGATVRAARLAWVSGEGRAIAAGSDTTDDRGQYRVFGLSPGAYCVSATGRSDPATPVRADLSGAEDVRTPTGYAPTYYPSAANLSEAMAVTVHPSQETQRIDIGMRLVRMADVSGVVATGGPFGRVVVSVLPRGERNELAAPLEATVSRDGTFQVRHVPPGRYLAFARELGSGGRDGAGSVRIFRFALQALVVTGEDVAGLMMALSPGGRVSGRVEFETRMLPRPFNLAAFRVMTAGLRSTIGVPPSVASVAPDGTFVIDNVPPLPVLLDATPARAAPASNASWQLKGIYLNGRDIGDTPVEVSPERPLAGVVVIFTDSPSGLEGTVRDEAGDPVAGCGVVAFSSDPAQWQLPLSRYLRMVRTDPHGQFRIRPLPPGRYHVHALAALDPLEWSNPEVLARLRDTASLATVLENEMSALDLKLVGR